MRFIALILVFTAILFSIRVFAEPSKTVSVEVIKISNDRVRSEATLNKRALERIDKEDREFRNKAKLKALIKNK